ncbi:MAG TPA: NAAT family transporter [Gemmatimonadaceae bacterium]|nr:NAAT family transporter [Gemmatimonadaceae bacterium]
MGQFAFITFTSILFLVDPIAVVPAYLAFVRSESPAQRKATARSACIAAAITLLVFASAGNFILGMFGVTLPAFRIAGGFILWLVAMDMLRAQRSTQEGTAEMMEGQQKDDVGITPLGIPMLAGPGAMSTVMVLGAQATDSMSKLVVHGSIVVTMLISWMLLRVADRVFTRMGGSGIRVATRIMGLLLAAVAVQFVISGAQDAGIISRAMPVIR